MKKIFEGAKPLVTIGGEHGITILIFKGLPKKRMVTIVQVDAHLDWRDEVNGEKEGYSSRIWRASEMDHIGEIFKLA